MQDPHIVGLGRFAPGFLNPASQALNPEKMFLRIALSQSEEK